MVGQLLKDIVEAAQRPELTAGSASFDRFGFRVAADDAADGSEAASTTEEKAERLLRRAEEDAAASETVARSVDVTNFPQWPALH